MTEYQTMEISNQQVHRDYPHMELTPRIEYTAGGQVYNSVCDLQAAVGVTETPERITFGVHGRLMTAAHQPTPHGEQYYRLAYHLSPEKVEIVIGPCGADPASVRLLVPVISQHDEAIERIDAKTVRISKGNGKLVVRTDAAEGFQTQSNERTFNLVPGFECIPLAVTPQQGRAVRVELAVEDDRSGK
jgi:hypothetical protein